MPSEPAKPRLRRLLFPAVTDSQQLLFTFDDDFPKDQRRQEAEKVLAARSREKRSTVVVPYGMHVQVRENADLPWQAIEPLRGRGQPRKTPAGTWEDDDLLDKVKDILGDPDLRQYNGPEIDEAIRRLGLEVLGPERFTDKRRVRLQFLVRKAIALKVASEDIVRELRAWRHDLTDPAVREMQKRLHHPVAHVATTLVLKYTKYDEHGHPDGPPICDDEGQPVLWVPDQHGQPSRPHTPGDALPRRQVMAVRPRIELIFH